MIRKTEEPEKTLSGLIKTIYDWDNLDLVAEAIEIMNNIVEPSPYVPATWVGDLRYNKFGEMVAPPKKPVAPEPIDTRNWKRVTPKRREKLAQYRRDKEQYEVALVEYERAMKEWLELPTSNKTKLQSIYEDYEKMGRVLKGDKGFIFLDVLPKPFTPTYKVKIIEVEEGDWVQREIYDPKWRIENQQVLRKWKKQHRRDFIRNQPDSTVQTTLTNNCWNAREVTSSILFTFEGEDTELARKYLDSIMDYGRPVLNGKYRIPDIYITGTPQEIEELGRRARMVRGQSL